MTDYWETEAGQAMQAPGSEWRAKESVVLTNFWATEDGQARQAEYSADNRARAKQKDLAILDDVFDHVVAHESVNVSEIDNQRQSDLTDKTQVLNFREHISSLFHNLQITLDVGVWNWSNTDSPYSEKKFDPNFSFSGKFDWQKSPA